MNDWGAKHPPLPTTFASVRTKRTSLRTIFASLRKAFASLQTSSASLQTLPASLRKGFTRLQTSSARLRKPFASLRTSITSLRTLFASLRKRFASLQTGCASHQTFEKRQKPAFSPYSGPSCPKTTTWGRLHRQSKAGQGGGFHRLTGCKGFRARGDELRAATAYAGGAAGGVPLGMGCTTSGTG
jgi:hypothetical protein